MDVASLVDDAQLRQRLVARFGSDVESWFVHLPHVLAGLAERWDVAYESLIPRGTMSAVLRCRLADGRAAVLKISPDQTRLAAEAAALAWWQGDHAANVIAVDESAGALLTEAIEPGTPLAVSRVYPELAEVAELLAALHAARPVNRTYPSAADRAANLFVSSSRLYDRHPQLAELVPTALHERGRRLAERLAHDPSAKVLLHGDLTPNNVLDGGRRSGLVAIDPAPTVGEPAFDAVDLVLWQAESLDVVEARAESLASAVGTRADRLLDWCRAFAAMSALELASFDATARLDTLLALADQAAFE